jgi:hypothetical protein
MEIYWSCGPTYASREIGNAVGVWCEYLLVHSPTDNMKSVYYTKCSFVLGYTSLERGTLRKSSFDELVFYRN